MYKVKSHSGAKKRFKKMKNGGFKAARAGRRHLLTKKNSKRKRSLCSPLHICQADISHIISLLPY